MKVAQPATGYAHRIVAPPDSEGLTGRIHPAAHGPRPGDLLWLVRLRWVAVAAMTVAILTAHAMHLVSTTGWLLAVAGLLVVCNSVWLWQLRTALQPWTDVKLARFTFVQLLVDVTALSLVTHLAGGIENPFDKLFAFNAALGGILLPRRMAWQSMIAGGLVHSALVLGTQYGVLDVHPLNLHGMASDWATNGRHVAIHLGIHWLEMIGIVYFVRTLRVRKQLAEQLQREHERVARNHERMARVGELSAGVAHAIRNPLHGALNCVDILGQCPHSAEGECPEIRGMMKEGLSRIDRVTRRLLVLTHSAAPAPVRTSLPDMLNELARVSEARALDRAVTIDVRVAGLPEIDLDPDRIGEAFLNIIDNAIDASAPGGVVTVRSGLRHGPEPGVWIEVADSGAGIPAAVLPHLFQPFFTTKPVGEGSGIGLAIARRAVHDHGGDIEAMSEPGQGACIRITLPCLRAP